MDHPVTFARHFARLLWLVLEDPDNTEEQKSSLRALVTVSQQGPVTLVPVDGGIRAGGADEAPMRSGMGGLATRLREHGIRELAARAAASPGDLLTAARLLAGPRSADRSTAERLLDSGATTVHFVEGPPAASRAVLGDFDLVPDEVISAAVGTGRPRGGSVPVPAAAGAAPAAAGDPSAGQVPAGVDGLLAIMATVGDDEVLAILDRVADAAAALLAEGKAAELCALLVAVIRREERAGAETRRYVAMNFRRMVSAGALRLIAAQLPRRVLPRDDIELVLTRTTAEGADALIDLLTHAQSATDRRAYFDMLRSLRAAIPALTHMLGDHRWYVVRNAVELLGEMNVVDTERAVIGLLEHEDERVRASATATLLRFDTAGSRAAVQGVLQSDDPAARQRAITAIGARRAPGASATLLRALAREEDPAVERTIYAALGKVASAEAVQQLLDAAAPGGGLFKRKSPVQRAAATLALGDAKSAAAVAALEELARDRDREVREAAQRGLANARRVGPEVTSVFAARPRP